MKNFFDQFDVAEQETSPNFFDQFDVTPPKVGQRIDLMPEDTGRAPTEYVPEPVKTAATAAAERVVQAYDWAQEPPQFVKDILADSQKALMQAPAGTLEETLAKAGMFAGELVAPMTSPMGVATLATGPAVRAVGQVAPQALAAARGIAAGIQTAATLPAAEAAGAALGEASVEPTAANIGAAAGNILLAGLGATGAAIDAAGIRSAYRARNVVNDQQWNSVRDRVRTAQAVSETEAVPQRTMLTDADYSAAAKAAQEPLTLPPEGGAPLALPAASAVEEFVQTVLPSGKPIRMPGTIPSGEVIRMPEVPTEVELATTREAAATTKFNERVKRVMDTMAADGVKLQRWQAAEMARMAPDEYNQTRQMLLDMQQPESPTAVEIKPPAPTKLKSFEELTPEMVPVPAEPAVTPKKTGVVTTEAPILSTAEKAAEGLGEPAMPVSPRMLELERPMYDSGLVDEQGNRIWVDEQGRSIDRRTYENPRERVQTPEEKAVYDQQLTQRVEYEKAAEANERVTQIVPTEPVVVSLPDAPAPVPATYVRAADTPGQSVVATSQGETVVPNTAINSAESVNVTNDVRPPVVTKVKDPTIGGYDVQIGNNKYRIFRDPEDRWWYLDAAGHHSGRVLSTENRAAAIRELVENEERWMSKIAEEERRLVRSRQAAAAKPSTTAELGELAPGLDTGAQKVQLALSAVPSSAKAGAIPGLDKLHKLSQTDPTAARLLSDIAADSLRFLVKDIPSAKVEYSPAMGLYGGELEGSLGVKLKFDAADRPKVLSVISRFANNFYQEQVHMRSGAAEGTSVGDKYSDGSFNTLVLSWKAKGLTRPQIEKLAKESGLYGFTLSQDRLTAYYVGDPTNAAQIEQFTRAGQKVSKSLGRGVQQIERLWIYGRDGIKYPDVRGELPIASTERNATAQRIAARLASREVKPVPQEAKLTTKQAATQTEIAKDFQGLRMNALLTDWRVKRAYTELAEELLQQYDSMPLKIEILSGKGEPYKNSQAMRTDVLGNNHLFIFGTDAKSFGPEGIDYKDHPLLQDSGRVDINGKPLLFNDLLRAVHDYYAHTMSPVQFGVLGEEAAWKNHMAMTRSPWARWALTSETRGQNSFVNFGPDAAWNKAHPKETKFAPQKTDLLPLKWAKTGDPTLDAEMDAIGKMKTPMYERQRQKKVFTDKERGAINFSLLSYMGQTAVGPVGGFVYGYNKDPNATLDERVSNGMQWALFGLTVGNPTIRNAIIRGVYRAKIPINYLGPTVKKAAGGMDNFVVFTQSVLGEVYDVIKAQTPTAQALSEKVARNLGALESMRGTSSPTDWYSAMQVLSNYGNANAVLDPKLRASVLNVRSTIDDFTTDMISRGMVTPGSDLEFTMVMNRGKYLTRTYEIFTNPDFQYDPAKQQRAIAEYVRQMVASGSTKSLADLQQEGLELTLFQLAKTQGTALAPNARSFALGKGIARVDGSILKPRKELSDAWRAMMGEIDDPVRAATLTVDRMADIIAGSITQTAMADVGLRTGLFTRSASATHSIPLRNVQNELAYGPLNDLWTTPEVRDGLYSMRAYTSHSVPFRALATLTGSMKIAKTVLHPISYAPNFLSAMVQPLTQGLGYQLISNPKGVKDAFQVVFGKSFPASAAQLEADIPILVRGGLLRQNVNLNDLVETARASFVPGMASRVVTWVPQGAQKAAKATLNGALSAYGKAEEFPRIIAFYGEVERYSHALFGKASTQLTTPERAVVYDKALAVSRDVYPNSQAVPEAIKKLSISGVLEPFVAYKWETLFRTPYNTMKRGLEDLREGQATGNGRLITAGVARISSLIGAMYGAYALNEAFNQTNGMSGEQDKALRRRLPKWDRTGMLIITDFDAKEVAYANQSYIMPQSLPAAAIKAAIDGLNPTEAAALFLKETAGGIVSDGGLFLKPVMESVIGVNEFGRRLYPRDGGKYMDVSGIQSEAIRNLATQGQNLVAGTAHALRNLEPGFMTEATKWYKMAREEVGPDGQLYKLGDLAARLGGVRVNRVDLPLQFERQAGELFGRLNDAQTEFGRARNRKDATPVTIETAYQMMEQSRKLIWRDLVQHLRDGELLNQPKDQILKNLRESGIPSDFLLGAINKFYVPGKKDRPVSAREQFQVLMSLTQKDATAMWARIVATDPNMAKSMRPMFKEVALGRTEEERMILAMEDKDGTRSRTIAQMLLQVPDIRVRQARFQEMIARGLIKGETAVQLYGDPVQSAKTWAEAKVRLQMNQVPLPAVEPDSTPPTRPGATMKRPPAPFMPPMAPAFPAPAAAVPSAGNFREGGIYFDKVSGKNVRYQNGQFVPVSP